MRAHAQSGYSLVELLVVLALLGLISTAIAGGFSFGARVWERTERAVSTVERASGGHTLLRALLSNTYPRKSETGGPEPQVAFEGTGDRLTFLAATSAHLGEAGIARLTLTVERNGGAATLVLSSQAEIGKQSERKEVIVAGAREITFAYAEAVNGALRWTDIWQRRSALPALIRIRAVFAEGQGAWPDLIVRPRVDRGATCVFDPVSFECRRG